MHAGAPENIAYRVCTVGCLSLAELRKHPCALSGPGMPCIWLCVINNPSPMSASAMAQNQSFQSPWYATLLRICWHGCCITVYEVLVVLSPQTCLLRWKRDLHADCAESGCLPCGIGSPLSVHRKAL